MADRRDSLHCTIRNLLCKLAIRFSLFFSSFSTFRLSTDVTYTRPIEIKRYHSPISLFTFHTRKFLLLHKQNFCSPHFRTLSRVSSTNVLIFSQHTCSTLNISSRLLQFATKPNLPLLRPSKRFETRIKLLLYSRDKLFQQTFAFPSLQRE